MKIVNSIKYALYGGSVTLVTMLMTPMYVKADNGANIGEDVLNKHDTITGFGKFEGLSNTATTVMQDTWTLLTLIGFWGAVIMFICGVILYMTSGSSSAKDSAKKKITWIIVGVFLMSCVLLIIGTVKRVGGA